MTAAERYLRHGRRYGVGAEFWETAAAELDDTELRRLAAELGVKLPAKSATTRNRPSEAASQAGLTANNSRSGPTGRGPSVSSPDGRTCRVCGIALGPMNTTGLCRGHYQRDLMRERRAAAKEAGR